MSRPLCVLVLLVLVTMDGVAVACGPGRGAGRRKGPKKLTPLVFKQHEPNVSENTLGASGLSEGPITRSDPRFKDLVPNYNSDIVFKDEEGTGADRLMTQRCKEKLNTLAISVMNQWPGVRLRVTEGFDEDGTHALDSLHYEGRAVDITTDDRDRSKYGMLARLAVEVGFDWVYYESRSHIHCSVRSETTNKTKSILNKTENGTQEEIRTESSQAAKSGGCFTENGTVILADGSQRRMADLKVGDYVLSFDRSSGKMVYSEVIMFLDRNPQDSRMFLRLTTRGGASIQLTPSHLVLRLTEGLNTEQVFAAHVLVGDHVMVQQKEGVFVRDTVVSIEARWVDHGGVYAPLTRTGTLVVDDVLVSCYAVIDSQTVAHLAFAPFRLYFNMKESFERFWTVITKPLSAWDVKERRSVEPPIGIHPYAKLLYILSDYIIPKSVFFGGVHDALS